jgi:hypothetical protein
MANQIKLHVAGGWSNAVRDIVIELCEERKLPFIDRASCADRAMKKSGITIINYKPGMKLPDDYLFYGHRGMDDLPYSTTIGRGA